MRDILLESVQQRGDLPPLPETLVRLTNMVEDLDTGINDVSQLISTDAILSAKLIALANTALDIQGVRSLLEELGIPQMMPTTVYEDNTACKAIAESDCNLPKKARHIRLRDLKVKEMVYDQVIAIEYCRTIHQLADLLSKNLNSATFYRFANYITGYSHTVNGIIAFVLNLNDLECHE